MAYFLSSSAQASRRAGLLAALILLAGCKLVDQTTFGAAPVPPGQDELTRALAAGSGIPLVTIRFDGGEVAYYEQLRMAVDMAEARKPDVQFDVVTVVPASGTPAEQVAQAERSQMDAQQVMDAMGEIGINPDRVRLSARTDPALSAREVRVYVR